MDSISRAVSLPSVDPIIRNNRWFILLEPEYNPKMLTIIIKIGDNENVAKKAVDEDNTNGSFLLNKWKASFRALEIFFNPVNIIGRKVKNRTKESQKKPLTNRNFLKGKSFKRYCKLN